MYMAVYELLNIAVLIMLVILVTVSYSVRLILKGRARFDRVNRQGGSVLLGKPIMEMAYWALQPVAKLLVFLRITPNQLSWASLVLGGIAGVAFAYGYFGYGAVFATYSAFFDSLDGMVARMTGHASDAGEVLDAAVDRYVEFFFFTGLIVFYRHSPFLVLLAMCPLMGSFMISYSTAKAEAMQVPPPSGIMRRPERAVYLTLGAALSTIPMPWLESSFGYDSSIGYPMIAALIFVGALSNISAIERLWTIALMIRERESNADSQSIGVDTLGVDTGGVDTAFSSAQLSQTDDDGITTR